MRTCKGVPEFTCIMEFLMLILLCSLPASNFAAPLRGTNMVDMTYDLVGQDQMPRWPSHKMYEMKIVERGPAYGLSYLESNNIDMAEHTATHMDAPAHIGKDRWRLHQIPKENLVADAVVVDISDKAAQDPSSELALEDLEKWEKTYGRIPDRAFVFMNSGWQKYWHDKEKFLGTKNFTNPATFHHPGFGLNATKWLVDERNVIGLGSDTLSLDTSSDGKYFPTHVYALERNVIGFEMVANLSHVPPRGATVYAFPIAIKDGSGGPIRMMAFWNASSRSTGSLILVTSVAFLLRMVM